MTLEQSQQQLHDLNAAYFNGEIGFSDYRKNRSLILESLFRDDTVPHHETLDTVPTLTLRNNGERKKRKSASTVVITLISLFIVVILSALVYLVLGETDAILGPLTHKEAAQGQELIGTLDQTISKNIWNTDQFARISQIWDRMTAEEQKQLRNNPVFSKFIAALKDTEMEQRALADLGNEKAKILAKEASVLIVKMTQPNP